MSYPPQNEQGLPEGYHRVPRDGYLVNFVGSFRYFHSSQDPLNNP